MYLSKDGMSFFRILHKAPISRTSPETQTCLNKNHLNIINIFFVILKCHVYSRAKISCCLVSAEPLVGKKFSSNNDTCQEKAFYVKQCKQWDFSITYIIDK